MPNYTIKPKAWTPLSDVMGDDYETTTAFKIRVNKTGKGVLQILKTKAKEETPDDAARGAEYPEFSEITASADTGDLFYLKASDYPICVFIEPVEV